jgi:hypothetical protein
MTPRRSLVMREPSRRWRRSLWFVVAYLLVVYVLLRLGAPHGLRPSQIGWSD